MKDILIVFVAALVLGSVINGMPQAGNNGQQAQPTKTVAIEDDSEEAGSQMDLGPSVASLPLDSASDSNFQNQVLNQNIPVLVDFYTQSCPHCRNMEPVLGRLASEYGSKLKIVKVDVMESPSVALKYDVGSVPAFVLFDQGKPVASLVGEMPRRRLVATIKPYLKRQDAEDSEKMLNPAPTNNQSG
jgi:thioredoxin 1